MLLRSIPAIRHLINYGTAGYLSHVRRRLKILNVMAMLIAISSSI